ncbi:ribonuclease E activity regulator RraA [Alkalicoccus luteus]|uniref:4-hydroxy-4-methyl-2-oxoglutarate aldolase n=1 Tax=Alkalicoccus luteus TaxID=1237094 RepID=A0A969Q1J8_9BACI|nr:ribonuclease E activity regulator RraA [Alkalicoccus luteus]NJP39392.1 ribonuclease E activity regulator RraA [Alkalicoccus luteus]
MKPVTDICDEHAEEVQTMQEDLVHYGARRQFSGPVRTVSVFEDNVLVKRMLEEADAGTVIVVDGGGRAGRTALLGDNLAAIGAERNIAGVIINGFVRDAAELVDIELGIVALGTRPCRSHKGGKGYSDIPLNMAGVLWEPGMWVYADEDGIAVLPEKSAYDK